MDELNTNDYDGYNLVIEGSGSGTIDILWDSNEFAINPAFLEMNQNSGKLTAVTDAAAAGWKKATLTVNSNEDNRIVAQFYKVKEDEYYIGAEFPSKYIRCENYIAKTEEAEEEPEEEPGA